MRTASPIQLYRFAKSALQVGEFTIAEMRSLARIPRGTVDYALSNLRAEIPNLFKQIDVREQKVGRPSVRYLLTETGEKALARKVAELGRKIAENDRSELVEMVREQMHEPARPEAKVFGWLESLEAPCREALANYSNLVFRPAEPVTTEASGAIRPVSAGLSYSYERILEILRAILTGWQWNRLEQRGWTAGSYRPEGMPTVDICVTKTGSAYAVEVRPLAPEIPSFDDLHLPARTREFCLRNAGLVLVCGRPGSGKSHAMASVVNCMNQSVDERIATIEEPARYFYPRGKALLDQKQVAIDTPDYAQGLDLALASGARIIALGEMAEPRTFSIALEAASTKLVFCRLSAASPPDAVRAIVERYSSAERSSILAGLAKNLVGMIFVKSLPRTQPEGGEILAAAAVHCDARFRASLADPDWDTSVTKALVENEESHETLRESVCSLYEKRLVDKHTLEETIGSVEKCRW